MFQDKPFKKIGNHTLALEFLYFAQTE